MTLSWSRLLHAAVAIEVAVVLLSLFGLAPAWCGLAMLLFALYAYAAFLRLGDGSDLNLASADAKAYFAGVRTALLWLSGVLWVPAGFLLALVHLPLYLLGLLLGRLADSLITGFRDGYSK